VPKQQENKAIGLYAKTNCLYLHGINTVTIQQRVTARPRGTSGSS